MRCYNKIIVANPEPDFRKIFESSPGAYLILSPEFNIVAASDIYLKVAMVNRQAILGRNLFDVFPDNPDDPTANGVANLTHSLHVVLETKRSHIMSLQKYDVRTPKDQGGEFVARYWRPENWPILDDKGEVIYITHYVEEVTHMIDVLGDAMDKQIDLTHEKKQKRKL